jgi:hypothetical protein
MYNANCSTTGQPPIRYWRMVFALSLLSRMRLIQFVFDNPALALAAILNQALAQAG